MRRLLVVSLLLSILAPAAHAQDKTVCCAFGYAFSEYLEEESGNAPFGLYFSVQSTKDLGLKVEVAYHRDPYEDFDITVNTFTGMIGPVANFGSTNHPFVHLLFGGREDRVEGEGNFAIGGELGVGVDIPIGTSSYLRPGVDYQVFTDEGVTLNILRLSFGIAF